MAPRLPVPAEARRKLDEYDRRWPVEFGLRAFATFLAFVGMIVFAATVKINKDNYGGNDWTDGFPIASLLISILYNPILVLMTIISRQGRPIHPGSSVTADLFVWALGVPAIVFSVGEGWFLYWQPVRYRVNGRVPCRNRFNFWSEVCNETIYDLGRMEIAGNVFLALVMIIHFALFVRACIMTHRWRKQRKGEGATRRNIELQYHRDPEEHQQGSPPAYVQRPANAASAESLSNPFRDPVASDNRDERITKYA